MTANINKIAVDRTTAHRPAFFYESAREGMRDFLVNRNDDRGVLLPGFIGWSPREGSGVFDPVRELGCSVMFYGLNEDLSVKLDEVASLIRTGKFGTLVVIHYFGRSLPNLDALRQLANEWGVVLVEDLAHGFFSSVSGGTSGAYGDVSFYSLHKMFPFSSGGMAVYQNASLVTTQRSTRPELAVDLLSYDWTKISATRRRNFTMLTELLLHSVGCGEQFTLLWPTLNADEVPQTLPVFIAGDWRDDVYERMNSQGFGMVSLYHTLIDEVRSSQVDLVTLSHHIINFPVHQDVSKDDVGRMADYFEELMCR